MYKIIENTSSLYADKGYFFKVTCFYDLKGSFYDLELTDCKRLFILCSGKANLLLESNHNMQDKVTLSKDVIVVVEPNINVRLVDYTKTTKIICVQERACID